MAELVIRKMSIIDIDEVMEVEKSSFAEPWPKEIFAQEVSKNDYAYYFVAQLNNKVIGYAGMWVVIDDAQITNIAIIPQYRRSEEHTSELQSRGHPVCRLLLEYK